MTQKPSFKFSLSFPGKIWQTALDTEKGIWALEIRDADRQQITYQLVYLNTMEMQALGAIEEADWWTVMLKMRFPFLLLEKYNDPQNPTDKDLLLFNVKKLKIAKSLSQFQFEGFKENKILGHNPADRNDPKSFNLTELRESLSSKGERDVVFPVYFPPASENMQVVRTFLQSEPSGVGCEYLEKDDCIIISYYVRLDRKFDRKLLVLKGDDELYHEVQDSGLDGYASGAFFVYENLLVFIKNGNQINGVEL